MEEKTVDLYKKKMGQEKYSEIYQVFKEYYTKNKTFAGYMSLMFENRNEIPDGLEFKVTTYRGKESFEVRYTKENEHIIGSIMDARCDWAIENKRAWLFFDGYLAASKIS